MTSKEFCVVADVAGPDWPKAFVAAREFENAGRPYPAGAKVEAGKGEATVRRDDGSIVAVLSRNPNAKKPWTTQWRGPGGERNTFVSMERPLRNRNWWAYDFGMEGR